MKEPIIIDSFESYISSIRCLKNKHKTLWFRGQIDYSWGLIPNIKRRKYPAYDALNYPIKESNYKKAIFTQNINYVSINPFYALEKFKKEYGKIKLEHKYMELDDFLDPKNDVEWMILGQHYGLLTPLLDWTTDPLVALFFATVGIEKYEDEDRARVWVVNPFKANEIFLIDNHEALPDPSKNSDYIIAAYKRSRSICFLGNKKNPRICRQSGNFMMLGEIRDRGLDKDLKTEKDGITAIDIPYSAIKEIKDILKLLDVTRDSIFLGESLLDKKLKKICFYLLDELDKDMKNFYKD